MDTKETTIYHAVLIASTLIGTIITFFIFVVINQQRKLSRLYKEKLETEINTLEKERIRIAKDLHDDLGPSLSAAKYKLSSMENLPGSCETLKDDAVLYIDSIVSQVRDISNNLMPVTLLRNGLVAAITELAGNMAAASNLVITFTRKEMPSISQHQQIQVYRIIQEIIHNSIKHASASRLRIEISGCKNNLLIATADDGIGFNVKKLQAQHVGFGINSLRNRTENLSGVMHIDSKPGKGTRILIEVPITKNAIANEKPAFNT